MTHYCPSITCRLTDQYGNVVSPYNPASIRYTILSFPPDDPRSRCCCTPGCLTVAVEGYVSVFSDEERISPPIPFSTVERIRLNVSMKSMVAFEIKDFHCWAIPSWYKSPPVMKQIQLLISIETVAVSRENVNLRVPQVNSHFDKVGCPCIYAPMICDKVQFRCGCCINYKNVTYRAEIYQYNTIADGVKRIYRNSDELTEYGDRGILAPDDVSYYNVFVNGVMQPKSTYVLKEGEIAFTTENVPAEGRTIIILFTTWKDPSGQIMDVTVWQYNTISDGTKKIYTNADEIIEYGDHGIPGPCDVSYFNLYCNGVLQPKVNYSIERGILKLNTTDAPVKGAPIVLESIIIKDQMGNLFRTEALSYNALSNGGKIYTNQDELMMYGNQGIPDPSKTAFQNLFVNSIIQPPVNYSVREGYLVMNTTDSPTVGAPITLQSVKNIFQSRCCNVQMSNKALAQWKKEYLCIKCSCKPDSL